MLKETDCLMLVGFRRPPAHREAWSSCPAAAHILKQRILLHFWAQGNIQELYNVLYHWRDLLVTRPQPAECNYVVCHNELHGMLCLSARIGESVNVLRLRGVTGWLPGGHAGLRRGYAGVTRGLRHLYAGLRRGYAGLRRGYAWLRGVSRELRGGYAGVTRGLRQPCIGPACYADENNASCFALQSAPSQAPMQQIPCCIHLLPYIESHVEFMNTSMS